MGAAPKPGPGLFNHKRSTTVPANPGSRRKRHQPHGFGEALSPCGDVTLTGYVDTTVLFSFGGCTNHGARLGFLERYQERARTGKAVVDEVDRWRKKDVRLLLKGEQPKVAAAKAAKASLLAGSKIAVFDRVDTRLLNAVLEQLEDYSSDGDWRVHHETAAGPVRRNGLAEHAGEAVLITHAMSHANAILLTNDAGASAIAEDRGIVSWHFGHLVRELLCNGLQGITLADATAMFAEAMRIANIRDDIRPTDPGSWLACRRQDDGTCDLCSGP